MFVWPFGVWRERFCHVLDAGMAELVCGDGDGIVWGG